MQKQILDIPELFSPDRGSGLFCGHDWTGSDFSEELNQQAYKIAEEVGKQFKAHGYKGIFGIDFIMDEKAQKLYVVEANPRMLGTFPTITMIQIRNNEPPLAAFHLLEYLDADYEIDIDAVNEEMRKPKRGAHMLMHNLEGKWARNFAEVKPGVYKIENEELKYLRPGYALKHIEKDDEFVVTEGIPYKMSHFSPNRRVARILTMASVTDGYKKLNPWAYKILEKVYQAYDLRKVRCFKVKRFFNPKFLLKG